MKKKIKLTHNHTSRRVSLQCYILIAIPFVYCVYLITTTTTEINSTESEFKYHYDSIVPNSSTLTRNHKLIWFLHFHKAAGNSFIGLASFNNETKRGVNDKHSHFELDRQQKEYLRWPLVLSDAAAASRNNNYSYQVPSSCNAGKKMIDWKKDLQVNMDKNVTFVSTEHWFPATYSTLTESMTSNVKFVTVMRDPTERLLSSYYFHGCASSRCGERSEVCRLSKWAIVESNMYTSMLNGYPFGPKFMSWPCIHEYSKIQRQLTMDHLQLARENLQKFDLVMTLDSWQKYPEAVKCAMQKVLGWSIKSMLPRDNSRRKKQCPVQVDVPLEAESWEVEKTKELNKLDIELYRFAQDLELTIFDALGCSS